jgi:hypothetical protein
MYDDLITETIKFKIVSNQLLCIYYCIGRRTERILHRTAKINKKLTKLFRLFLCFVVKRNKTSKIFYGIGLLFL